MPYNEAFKANVVRKLTGPSAVSANALAKELGVHQSTLSRWLREASSLPKMSDEKKDPKKVQAPAQWSIEEKLRVVVGAAGLTGNSANTSLDHFFVRGAAGSSSST